MLDDARQEALRSSFDRLAAFAGIPHRVVLDT
jgi:hypothetical protein